MPSPYPRACAQCAKVKKRCDLGTPRCSRCHLRSQECRYDGVAARIERPLPEASPAADSRVFVDFTRISQPFSDHRPPMDLVETDYGGSTSQAAVDFDRDLSVLLGGIDGCIVPDSLEVPEMHPNAALAGDIYQDRLVYGVKSIQACTAQFVKNGHTIFVHKSLYKETIPFSIQDALAACALYTAKNERNQSMVFKIVREKANSLVEFYEDFEALPFDRLAALQSLALYQIIRLFDGDIRMRAEAEAAEPVFMRWTKRVQSGIQEASSEQCLNSQRSHDLLADPWKSWVFSESQRRTIMVCYSIKALYSFLKHSNDGVRAEFEELSFFAQQALWNAPSEYSWRYAIEHQRLLPALMRTWDIDMEDAQPSDMEDLGMMLMVMMKGVDHCSHWVGAHNLEKFGLAIHSP